MRVFFLTKWRSRVVTVNVSDLPNDGGYGSIELVVNFVNKRI